MSDALRRSRQSWSGALDAKSHWRTRRTISLLLVSALFMGGCLLGLWKLRQDELVDEQANLRRLSITLAEQTALAFREIDLVLHETKPYLTPEAMATRDDTLHQLLHGRFLDLQQGQALMAFGPRGQMLGHSRVYPTPQVNISDRDYFIAQQPGGDALFISAPLRNRVNGRWMISLSRRLSDKNDRFAGVIMAAVEIDYFMELYRSLNLPPDARLTLCRVDGIVLAAYPLDESLLGKAVPSTGKTPDDIRLARDVPSLPLYIRLTLPRSAALQNWRRYVFALSAAMLALFAGLAALTASRRTHMRQLRLRTELLQRSEEALRLSETRYRTIVDTANEGICTFDAALNITYVNRVFAGMLGYEETEMLGRPANDFLTLQQPDSAGPNAAPWRQRERGQVERRLRAKNGEDVWAIVSSTPMFDAAGAFSGSFAMLTDISRRKEEEKFREGIESILRHDLRSPLASMSYIPPMLLDSDNLTEQQRWTIKEMRKYVRKMLRMVDAYLKLATIEKDSFQPELKAVDSIIMLAEVEQELGQLLSSGRKHLVITRDGQPLAPNDMARIMGEEALYQTMLGNLIKNALEASPEKATILINLHEENGRLLLTIHNQGEVPPAIRGRFFQKYVTAGKHRGTGLGAYSARMIAEAHGGSIALDTSEPGATTVRVTLPSAV